MVAKVDLPARFSIEHRSASQTARPPGRRSHRFLESVSRLLAAAFDIVATAADGRQALDLARRLRPDVVVLDVAMPDLDGFQTLEQLRRDGLDTRVVFLTMHRMTNSSPRQSMAARTATC